MPTKAQIDQAFLAKHAALTDRFYSAQRAGLITPALQALFDKAHGYLSLVHMRAMIVNGIDQDYYVDEVVDDNTGVVLSPGTKLRSQELTEAIAGLFKLKVVEIAEILTRWRVNLG